MTLTFFRRRFFPARNYRLPLRWVLWLLVVLLLMVAAAFVRMLR